MLTNEQMRCEAEARYKADGLRMENEHNKFEKANSDMVEWYKSTTAAKECAPAESELIDLFKAKELELLRWLATIFTSGHKLNSGWCWSGKHHIQEGFMNLIKSVTTPEDD